MPRSIENNIQNFIKSDNYEEKITLSKKIWDILEQQNIAHTQPKDFKIIADYLNEMNHFYDAKKYYDLYLNYIPNNNQLEKAEILRKIAVIFLKTGKYKDAITFLYKSLNIFHENTNPMQTANIYNNLAAAYYRMFNLDKSIKYYEKSIKIKKELNDTDGVLSIYNNISLVYKEKGEYETALNYLKKSLNIKNTNDKKYFITKSNSLSNIGLILLNQKKYEEALKYLFQAKKIKKKFHDEMRLSEVYSNIAACYNGLTEPDKALKAINKSFKLAKKVNSNRLIAEYYKISAQMCETKNDFKQSCHNLKKYIELEKHLVNEDMTKQIAELENFYNIELKEKDILIAKNKTKIIELENKKLEDALEIRNAQLQKMEKFYEVGKFASSIVHNLRNPLQAIKGGIELAEFNLKKSAEDPKMLKYFDIIKQSANNIEKMIKSITFNVRNSTIEKDEKIDLNDIIVKVLDFFSMNSDFKNNVKILFHLEKKLNLVLGNPVHFNQIFSNLIKNSYDAMENSDTKEITITSSNLGRNAIIIKIADCGTGISKENYSKIFSTDFSTKGHGKGTGLGLPITKQMIESYRGTLDFESEIGKGTVFNITLLSYNPEIYT